MLDINYSDKKAWMHRYPNVSEYYHDAIADTDCSSRSSRKERDSWSGSSSFEVTEQRYSKGYPEGTALARQMVMKLTPFLRTVKGVKRGWKNSMHAGGNFNMDAYNKGLPECCVTMQPVVSKKFASLIVNTTASCGVSTEVMQRRGVACLALAQVLETNGYRVSIKLAYALAGDRPHKQFCIVDVKPFNQTADMDRLAFFLADPSAFRRLHFSWMEAQPREVRRIMWVEPSSGYGMPIELPSSEITDKDIYLGCANLNSPQWHSLDSAQEWIKESLKRYGVQFYG